MILLSRIGASLRLRQTASLGAPENSIESVVSLRPTVTVASPYSVSRQTSLSFRERPLASCPRSAPRASRSRPRRGLVTPRFHRASEGCWNRLTATFASDSCYSEFPRIKTYSAFLHSLRTVVRRDPPSPKVLPHRGVYLRCQEFCTIEAPLRAPRLGLGSFSLVGIPRGHTARLDRKGIPAASSVPFTLPRKVCKTLMHRGPTDSIQFSKCPRLARENSMPSLRSSCMRQLSKPP